MIKKFKTFFYKKNFDSSEGLINPYEFHFTCYYMLNYFQVLDDVPVPKWTYFILMFMVVCAIFAIFFFTLTFYHGVDINDLATITEGGCYCIILFYELLILLCTRINLPQYHTFLQILRGNFKYVCTGGTKYRKKYFSNQLMTWKMCIFALIFTCSVGFAAVSYATLCWLWHDITHNPGDGAKRPFFFAIWLFDKDYTKTPIYEILFIYANVCCLAFVYAYVFLIQTQILWIGEIRAMADLIIWYIEDLIDGLRLPTNKAEVDLFNYVIKSRLKEIVRQHNLMYRLLESYTKVYKKMLMFEQKASAPVICLTAYCAVEKLKSEQVNLVLILICVGAIVEVFIPSYLCTILEIKVKSVGDAFLNIPFWTISNIMRPYIIMIMQRSLRPLQLSAPGFEEVSLQTFSNKMASAYSFFNMLRQTNINSS